MGLGYRARVRLQDLVRRSRVLGQTRVVVRRGGRALAKKAVRETREVSD